MQLAVLKGSREGDSEDKVISCVPYAIGRCRSADLIIAHVNVSRNHCKIVKEDGLWKIYDFSSSGTYVNENLVGQGKSTTLSNGDRIRFGHLESNLCRTFHLFDGSSESAVVPEASPKSPGRPDSSERRCSGEADNAKVTLKQNGVPEGSEESHFDSKCGRTDEKLLVLEPIRETKTSQVIKEAKSSPVIKEAKSSPVASEQCRSKENSGVENKIASEKIEELAEELQRVRKALSTLEAKNGALGREAEANADAKGRTAPPGEKNLLENLADVMETELQCTICSELFVTAVTLGCTHTFCKYCIDQWKRKQKSCPVCRKKIVNETRSLVIDNYIDKMVGNLSVELKERREAIVKERSETGPFRKRAKLKG